MRVFPAFLARRDDDAGPVDEVAAQQVGIRNIFDGEVTGHDTAAGCTWLRAGALTLASPLRPEISPGTRARLIPSIS